MSASHPHLQPWQRIKVSQLTQALIRQLNITDPEAQIWAKSGVDHLLVMGYGLGWTTVREWLKPIKVERYQLAGFWCPLVLPNVDLELSLIHISLINFALLVIVKIPGDWLGKSAGEEGAENLLVTSRLITTRGLT
ncbi:hypothetical protein IQ225_18665 [Synechocystis salina LEGE 06155]|nr:hypothetical protein [Synechocystis salina LEGE 06155]